MTKKLFNKSLAFIFANISFYSFAGFKGEINFTAEEIKAHRENLKVIVSDASSCLKEAINRQNTFYKKHGIAAYYGDRSSFSKLSESAKRAELKRLGKNPDLLKEMRPTSCVGLALECLGRGFKLVKHNDVWNRIWQFTKLNDVDGMALQFALQKLGWKILYWNADPSQNSAWDRDEREADPKNKQYFQGFHVDTYRSVLNKQRYFYTNVDDTETLRDLSKYTRRGAAFPKAFTDISFFVGIAHLGYHVFPGYNGAYVVEAHSTRKITDPKTVQSSVMDPLNGGSPDGAPTGQAYRSGIIAVPPMN